MIWKVRALISAGCVSYQFCPAIEAYDCGGYAWTLDVVIVRAMPALAAAIVPGALFGSCAKRAGVPDA